MTLMFLNDKMARSLSEISSRVIWDLSKNPFHFGIGLKMTFYNYCFVYGSAALDSGLSDKALPVTFLQDVSQVYVFQWTPSWPTPNGADVLIRRDVVLAASRVPRILAPLSPDAEHVDVAAFAARSEGSVN